LARAKEEPLVVLESQMSDRRSHFTPEVRAKISVALIGKKLTKQHRARMRAAKLGVTLTPEHRANISAGLVRWAAERKRAAHALAQ
jgi:hypothetical protein